MADYAPVDLNGENQVTFELNGQKVSAPPGTMLVDACYAHGVEVPIFCYEPRVGPPVGACRVCLVEIEGMRGLQTACSTPVQQDMVVRTTSELAKDGQDGVLELLLANHPLDCPVCDKGGECPLQDRTFRFGPGESRFDEAKRHFIKPVELSSRIALDQERCIACYRCVRFSQEVSQDGKLTMHERGALSEITTFSGDPYEDRFTGNIIDICPVGALTSIPYRFVARPWDIQNTPSVCGLCPVGCNTQLTLREGEVKRCTGREEPNYAVEEGWLCDVGRWAYDAGHSDDRLTQAIVRDATGERQTDLPDAVAAAAAVLGRAEGRVGILVGPAATLEEAAIAIDITDNPLVARLGVPAGPLAALRAQPGAELGDVDGADLVVIVGGDPGKAQPITELRIRKAHLRGNAHVITVGTHAGTLRRIAEHVSSMPGALADGLSSVADRIAQATKPVVFWDEVAVAQEPAVAKALTDVLAANPACRQIELGADVNGAGLRAMGIRATGLREALESGTIGALIAVNADPLASVGRTAWTAALERGTPIIALATHRTATTDRATVVLPSQTMWEQEGTLVSMTGRAQRVRRGANGPQGTAPGWELLIALGHHVGRPPAYRSAAAAFAAAAERYPALNGLSYDVLGVEGTVLDRPMATHLADDTVSQASAEGDGLHLLGIRDVYGASITQRSKALAAFHTANTVSMAPSVAEGAGLADGDDATLTSPHGNAHMTVAINDELPDHCVLVTLGGPDGLAEALIGPEHGPVRVAVTKGTAS